MNDKKKLALEMKKSISFDAADCRNIVIYTNDLCKSALGVEVLEEALQLYYDTPEERIDSFCKVDEK